MTRLYRLSDGRGVFPDNTLLTFDQINNLITVGWDDHRGTLLNLHDTQYAIGQITNTQLKALKATPITVIAAPGTGYGIQVLGGGYFIGDFAAAVYVADTVKAPLLKYSGGATVGDMLSMDVTSGTLQLVAGKTGADYNGSYVVTTNVAIVMFHNDTGEWTGGNAANTLSYLIPYRIVPTTAFSS